MGWWAAGCNRKFDSSNLPPLAGLDSSSVSHCHPDKDLSTPGSHRYAECTRYPSYQSPRLGGRRRVLMHSKYLRSRGRFAAVAKGHYKAFPGAELEEGSCRTSLVVDHGQKGGHSRRPVAAQAESSRQCFGLQWHQQEAWRYGGHLCS